MRDLSKMLGPNDGSRTLMESIMVPEIGKALSDWSRENPGGVLIGGLALSYYVKPRMTQDIDFLFLSVDSLPTCFPDFKRTRKHAYQHNQTHVEVELVTPDFINVPEEIVKQVIATAIVDDGIKVASPSGLVVLKLFRLNAQDKADIIALIKTDRVDLDGFDLPMDKLNQYWALVIDAASEV